MIEFRDQDLQQLELDGDYVSIYPPEIRRAFRRSMQLIRAAVDERDLSAFRSLEFQNVGGQGKQHSLRLNGLWKLYVEITPQGDTTKLSILGISEDAKTKRDGV